LVYTACTLADLETTGGVEGFEAGCSQFERLAVHNPLAPGPIAGNLLTLWPQESGGNGMCIGAWMRTTP
jgi:16S rRNA C967 or C1407 C5-methylase (RsmB/RsmF family)